MKKNEDSRVDAGREREMLLPMHWGQCFAEKNETRIIWSDICIDKEDCGKWISMNTGIR